MIQLKRAVSLAFMFSLIFSLLWVCDANSAIYVHCSQLSFTSNTPYDLNVNSLFTSLLESATNCNFNTFKISPPEENPPNDVVVYGLFQCRGDLTYSDCRDCVANSVSQLKTTCALSIGGTVQLDGCFVKYDNTSFFGVADKMEMSKKCGPSIGYNWDVLNGRDDTLAYLIAQNGQYFRRSGSGNVQGVAQCVQDLSESDCQDCLAYACGQLRSECESSSWGDMFLEKCYTRYGDHGTDNYTYKNDTNNGNNNDHHDDADNNNLAKAIGIVLGAFVLTGGMSYCFSVSITKNVVKMNAQNTSTNNNKINIAVEGAKLAEKEAKDATKKADVAVKVAEDAKKKAEKISSVYNNYPYYPNPHYPHSCY